MLKVQSPKQISTLFSQYQQIVDTKPYGSCAKQQNKETLQSADQYRTWCQLNRVDGCCTHAGCDCTGDDGGCKHVVALLFSLSLWSMRHIDRNTETYTDRKCIWDIPREESKPKLLDEIEQSTEQTHILQFEHCFDPTIINQNDPDIDEMLLDLVKGFDTQIIEVLDMNIDNNNDQNVSKTLLQCIANFDPNGNISTFYYLSTCFDESDCTEINKLTDQLSESAHWYKYKFGRITSSVMHNVCN